MKKLNRKPTSVGEILHHEFLEPLNMTQKELANHVGCDVKVINRLVNQKTSLSAEMAIKLAATFNTSVEFWMNMQKAMDIYEAQKSIKRLPKPISFKLKEANP